MNRFGWLLAPVLVACGSLFAGPTDEARKLTDEALVILKANAQKEATTEEYAKCLFNLEKAQALLEGAGDNDSALAQEVTQTLFWTRRFSNVAIINALEKLRGGQPLAVAAKKPEPKKPEPKKPANADDPAEPPSEIAEAKKAYQQAESYANSKSGDDYAIALAWFKMANDFPGTDYALKALGLAREAQARFASKTAPAAEALPDTPEMKLVLEGDALAKAGKYEESFAIYKSSIALKDTPHAHRRLAHAYYKRGQQMKDTLMPRLEASDAAVRAAYKGAFSERRSLAGVRRVFNPNDPAFSRAKAEHEKLVKEAYKAIEFYDQAQNEFKQVLKLAPGGKDLDAAGHIGLCLSVRGDPMVRSRAKQHHVQFLKDYKPANDLERSLYEFCKTDLARISK